MTWWVWKCRAWRTVSIREYAKHGGLFTVLWNAVHVSWHTFLLFPVKMASAIYCIWNVHCQRYGVYRTLSWKRRVLQIAISAYYRRMRHMLYCKKDMSNRNLKRIIFQEKRHYTSLVYCVVGEFDADYLDGKKTRKYQKQDDTETGKNWYNFLVRTRRIVSIFVTYQWPSGISGAG